MRESEAWAESRKVTVAVPMCRPFSRAVPVMVSRTSPEKTKFVAVAESFQVPTVTWPAENSTRPPLGVRLPVKPAANSVS